MVQEQQQHQQQQQQFLVRFEDRTYRYDALLQEDDAGEGDSSPSPSCRSRREILNDLSEKTGWPADRLVVTSFDLPFVSVRVRSSLRGGKGGFGTLLRGSYRKQKSAVVDYGDCRDLQGRRLRQVVVTTQQALAGGGGGGSNQQPITTNTLLRLPPGQSLPGWAPANAGKLASQRVRQLERARRRRERLKRERGAGTERDRDEARARTESQVRGYVQAASEAAERIEGSVANALLEGLTRLKQEKDQKKRKPESVEEAETKRQRQEGSSTADEGAHHTDGSDDEDEDQVSPLSAVVNLSGDMRVVLSEQPQQKEKEVPKAKERDRQRPKCAPVRISNPSSNFATAGALVVVDGPDTPRKQQEQLPPSMYYEVAVLTGGLVQLGWALMSDFAPDSEEGNGVGDCGSSWGYDGSRRIKLHDGKEEEYPAGETDGNEENWQAGDVVGCQLLAQYDDNKKVIYRISYSLNGKDLGVAFEIDESALPKGDNDDCPPRTFFPVVSCNPEEAVELRLRRSEFENLPVPKDGDGDRTKILPVGRFLVDSTAAADNVDGAEQDAAETAPRKLQQDTSVPSDLSATKKSAAVEPEPLDLKQYDTQEQLEALGLDRLKAALLSYGNVKVGGTLQDRAERLLTIKAAGDPKNFPASILAKKPKK